MEILIYYLDGSKIKFKNLKEISFTARLKLTTTTGKTITIMPQLLTSYTITYDKKENY